MTRTKIIQGWKGIAAALSCDRVTAIRRWRAGKLTLDGRQLIRRGHLGVYATVADLQAWIDHQDTEHEPPQRDTTRHQ